MLTQAHQYVFILPIAIAIIIGVIALVWIIFGGIIIPSSICQYFNLPLETELTIVTIVWGMSLFGFTILSAGGLIAYHYYG